VLYWLKVYALIAAFVFGTAGLLILMSFAWIELKGLLRKGTHHAQPAIGIIIRS